MEDVNKRRRIFPPTTKLKCGPQEINSRKFAYIWHFQRIKRNATKLPTWQILPIYRVIVRLTHSGPGACFSKVSITFRPEKLFYVCRVCIQDQSSIILKMIQWNYQLTKQNWLVCELGTLLLFNWFWFQNLLSDPKSYRAFRETGPRLFGMVFLDFVAPRKAVWYEHSLKVPIVRFGCTEI